MVLEWEEPKGRIARFLVKPGNSLQSFMMPFSRGSKKNPCDVRSHSADK